MNYLSVENFTKSFGERVLFEDVSFGIDQGQKVAFVAKNGTGKSSLLKILAGQEAPDSGNVTFRKGIAVGFLDQDPNLPEDKHIIDAMFDGDDPIMVAIRRYERSLEHPEDAEEMQGAFDEMEKLQAWDAEVRVKQILGKLNLDQIDRPIGSLSGGQKKRVALAKLLIQQPDLIILDEPTNHLDIEMIEWLEEFLGRPEVTLFMVTHDRYFLDSLCDIIIELNQGQIFKYQGDYAYYLAKKNERYEIETANIDKAKNLYRKELDWMRRQPKARGTKSKARIDAFYDVKKEAHKRQRDEQVEMEIKMQRMGAKIVELHNVKMSYGELPILNGFNYTFKRKDRIGIVGRNGTGKTTFLKLLTGQIAPKGGKIVIGDTVQFGYYDQEGIELKEDQRVIDVVKDIAEVIPLTKGLKLTAAQLLERFLFSRDDQWTYVSKLSGGERRRLYLLTILMANPNFLILDEPTNDLDLITLTVLEDFLQEFEGVIVVVSHDRYFMNKLVDQLFVFEGGGEVKDLNGNYGDFRVYMAEKERRERAEKLAREAAAKADSVNEKPKEKKKLSYMEQHEYDGLEDEIEKLENRKAGIHEAFASGTLPGDEMEKLSIELGEIQHQIESKTDRWLELSELS
ncbi:MAG: ABC-F family ATP-binding cassette domain-containing protein [Flavobacteriales bacterium]|nr:ABC-F family ATP-binding cassette domain-containing protein [Flavobacteriales bacterium]